MTVQTTTTYQSFAGGQSVLTFNFRTLFSNPNYINVKVTNLSNNTTTLLTYGTNYTVSVNSTGVGGTVTVNPSYSTGYNYTVYRDTGAVQNSSYTNFNQFPGPTLENGLDQLTMLVQELATTQGLTVQVPLGLNPTISTTLPTPTPGNALGWDPTGTLITNLNLVSSGVMVIASAADASGGTQSTHYMTPSTTTIQLQANISAGSNVTLTTTSTQVIVGVNSATAGSNVILQLDSSGNIPHLNGSNVYSVSSTSINGTFSSTYISALFGAWTLKSVSTIYQASTDMFVLVMNITNPGMASIVSDSSSSPSTTRSTVAGTGTFSLFSPVIKGNYFEVIGTGSATIYGISIGS